jgi:hypothetical protein
MVSLGWRKEIGHTIFQAGHLLVFTESASVLLEYESARARYRLMHVQK